MNELNNKFKLGGGKEKEEGISGILFCFVFVFVFVFVIFSFGFVKSIVIVVFFEFEFFKISKKYFLEWNIII